MLILGLLLIIAAVALTIGAVYDGGEQATVELLGYDLSTTVAGVFFVGMGTTALLLLGVWLLQASFGRSRRRRQERKAAKLRQRESVQSLEDERAQLRAENERLAQKLAEERGEHAPAAAGTTAAHASADDGRDSNGAHRAATDDARNNTTSAPAPEMTAAPHSPPPPDSTSPSGHSTDVRTPEDSRHSRDI